MTGINLSEKDTKLLSAIIETSQLSFDWRAISTKTGHKTAKHARDSFYALRNKLCPRLNPKNGSSGSGGKKGASKRTVGGDDGDDDEVTPAKKTKKSKSTKEDSVTGLGSDGEDDAVKVKGEAPDDDDLA